MEETVHKNIEKYQTPNWKGHHSMLGLAFYQKLLNKNFFKLQDGVE